MIEAVIVHQIPGRLRLRIPPMRGDAGYFSVLSDKLDTIEGVELVKVNPASASVVVQYAGEPQTLLERMRELDLDPRIEDDTGGAALISGIEPIRLISGRDINPMVMLGSALTVIGLVQTFRGKIVVPSITAFWYALEAFRNSGKNR